MGSEGVEGVGVDGESVAGEGDGEGKVGVSESSSDKSLEWNQSFARSKSAVAAAS
jgi:hypothetical protein